MKPRTELRIMEWGALLTAVGLEFYQGHEAQQIAFFAAWIALLITGIVIDHFSDGKGT